MNGASAGALITVDGTLVVQLSPNLTDGSVRELRDTVARTLDLNALRGLVLDLTSVDAMDSYITRCIRDLAISARLMGVPTIVCGVQPAVADTMVEMGLELGEVPTVLNLDGALRTFNARRRPGRA